MFEDDDAARRVARLPVLPPDGGASWCALYVVTGEVVAMVMKSSFLVQPFERKRGRLVPARQEPAPGESGALKKAENLAKRMPGAAALKVVADDEMGELESVTVLGQWGEAPDDFAECLQGG